MYTVIELQTNNNVTSIITNVYNDINLAEQKYHQTLSYAAVSNVDVHAVSILDVYGQVVKNESYYDVEE